MKKLLGIILLTFLSVFLAGCTPFLVLPNETIKAPRTTGEFEDIQKALIESVGGDIKMKYPKVQGTSAAFTSGDVDGDGEGEILAFYQPDSSSSTHINILKHSLDGWSSIGDISPVGSNLERVELSDLDKDGALEIITGWSVYDSKNYELAIFSDTNGQLTRRTSEKYTDFILYDVDRDSVEEIVILLLDSANKTSSMAFYELSTDQLILNSTAFLDGTVAYYGEMVPARLSDGSVCIFVDGYMGNGAMLTEALNFTDEKLENLLYDEVEQTVSPSYRPIEIPLKTDDSRVLVPFVRPMLQTQTDTAAGEYLVDWMEYSNGEFTKNYTCYYCAAGGYEIEFDEEWDGKLLASYLSEERTLVFYEYAGENTPATEVFRVQEVPFAEDSSDIADPDRFADMIRIKTGETSAFFVSSVKDNPFNINTEKLMKSFILREE